ncbi:hypothetical protein MHYP_G00147330 [Metynnis hypsauchen]
MGWISLVLSPRCQQIKERRHVAMKVTAGLKRSSQAALGNGGGSVRMHEGEKLCGAASCCAESFVDIMPPSLRVGRLFTRSLTCSITGVTNVHPSCGRSTVTWRSNVVSDVPLIQRVEGS